MSFYVYLIATKINNKIISYAGYTNNLSKRLNLHNISKGAKFTKGKKWVVIYSKKYNNLSNYLIAGRNVGTISLTTSLI